MRTLATAILAVWLGVPTCFGATDDLLTQADRVAARWTQYASPILVGGALSRRTPRALAIRLVRRLELSPGTEAHLVGPDGRRWLSTLASPGRGPASREAMWPRVAVAPRGVSSDVALNDAWTDLVRRDIGWQEIRAFGWAGRMVIEQHRVLHRDGDQPWSGKWIGARSRQGLIFGRDTVTEVSDASPLSAILLQSGTSCWVRLMTADWVFESRGALHENALRAGAAAPVRILNLTYSPADDRLRGILESVAPDGVSSDKIFLQRVGVD